MRIDSFDLALRPRSMGEAADLGVALVQRHRASLWRCFAPPLAAVLAVALATLEFSTWLPWIIIFWLKPWLDRSLLFALSRAAFGQSTRWTDLWRERGAVLWRDGLATLTLLRLSPWRAYTQPILQLEAQRGKALRQRRNLMLRGRRPASAGTHFVFAQAELALMAGALALLVWLAPEGIRGDAFRLLGSDHVAWRAAFIVLYAAIVFVVEPFYVAAGFAMYLNRRVELEAWDVEQEFRRAFSH
jgi:hypothetical protein